MISKKTFKIAATCTAAAFVVPWMLSCGKGILDNEARQNTPAALLAEAMQEYDSGNYSAARVAYESVLTKHPNHIAASVGLAFALHGEAGKSIVDIVGNLIEQNGTGSGGSEINGIIGAVGLAKQPDDDLSSQRSKEYNELKDILDNIVNTTEEVTTTWTLEKLREKSETLTKFNKAWLTLCKVMPRDTLTNLHTWADAKSTRTDVFSLESCGQGIDTTNTAVLFAAALNIMTQVSILYQTVLDGDGEEGFDLMVAADTAKTKFNDLSGQTGLEYLSTLSSGINAMNTTIKKIDSEIMQQVFGDIQLLTELLEVFPGMPESAKEGLNEIKVKLDIVTNQLSALKTGAAQEPDSTPDDNSSTIDISAIRAKAQDATTDSDTKIAEAWSATTDENKQEYVTSRDQICSDFENLNTEMQLGATKPCACVLYDNGIEAATTCCSAKDDKGTCCDNLAPDKTPNPAITCRSTLGLPATGFMAFLRASERSQPPAPQPPARKYVPTLPEVSISEFENVYREAEAAWRDEVKRALEDN